MSVRRAHHQFAGDVPSTFGPIEFGWADGDVTTFDVRSDWTLEVVATPWFDPYADADEVRRAELAVEVGLWNPSTPSLADPLRAVVGQSIGHVEPIFDQVADLTGVEVTFEATTVLATMYGGQLVIQVIQH
ncbi:hypothetical protein ASD18_15505 [Cellulomonas sp. Root137]|nr:hypothetical protein ASD18_15505 [Cellulomonas sp. Root137]KRD45393.1 hypothetical protein ASE38_15670 [Cellulomonas sp. Root930]